MIRVRLREALDAHRQRTGKRMTYEALSAQAGVSVETLQSLATRPAYNTRLSTVEKLCRALGCTPGEMLEMIDNKPEAPR